MPRTDTKTRRADIGHRMLRIFDFATSVRSGSMMGDTWRQHYEGYEGLLHVLKLPRLNSLLTPPQPMSSSYLIKVYRRRLVLDPLHTPPEQGNYRITGTVSPSLLPVLIFTPAVHVRVLRRHAPLIPCTCLCSSAGGGATQDRNAPSVEF